MTPDNALPEKHWPDAWVKGLEQGREHYRVRAVAAEAEVERLRGQHERDLIQVSEAHEARRKVEAEVERLRETLRVVLSFGTTLPPDCREIVLEALNG